MSGRRRPMLVSPGQSLWRIPPEFGGPWLHDWKAYSQVLECTGTTFSVAAESWHTVLDIGGPGWLMYCRAVQTAMLSGSRPHIRVTADGVAATFAADVGRGLNWGSLFFRPIRFEASLKIEVYNADTASRLFWCDYLYLLDLKAPDVRVNSLRDAGAHERFLVESVSTSMTDVINVTGAGWLLHVVWEANTAAPRGSLTVDGVTKMSDRLGGTVSPGILVAGPVRFNTSIRIQHRCDAAGAIRTSGVYILD